MGSPWGTSHSDVVVGRRRQYIWHIQAFGIDVVGDRAWSRQRDG